MNRKQRKLKYIREKNRIRRFEDVVCIYKISCDLIQSTVIDMEFKMIDEAISDIKKIFKLDVLLKSVANGYVGDDFIYNLITFKIVLNRKTSLV